MVPAPIIHSHFRNLRRDRVAITWSGTHGIIDQSGNPFDSLAKGATWNYTMDLPRITLVASNSVWAYFKGLSEASTPTTAWREVSFDASSWSNGPAALYYGPDPYTGTDLSDMNGSYSCVFIRQAFNVAFPAALTNMILRVQSDDGCAVWVNGTNIARVRVPAGEIPFNGTSSANATESPAGGPAAWTVLTISDPQTFLVPGTNVIAVQAFNYSLAGSSDFGIDLELSASIADPNLLPPTLLSVSPSAGEVYELTNITVVFSKPVLNVDAGDLLVNGTPVGGVSGSGSIYTFSFGQPAYGNVSITWAASHGIMDTNALPHAFDTTLPGTSWQYTLLNPNAPVLATQTPLAGSTVNALTEVLVNFNKPVMGVDAADLLVNGTPATSVQGSNANYTFSFPQPAYGSVLVSWDSNHGISDLETPANAFDATRPGSAWTYTLVDQTAPVIVAVNPPAGAQVTNLSQITIVFSEAVSGVSAGDLLVNGMPASGSSGSGATYTFTFPQPNASIVNLTWANSHGIYDLAAAPNVFNSTAPGATWSYLTPDTLSPQVASITPAPFATVRSLTQVSVTFNEPVTEVDAADLLINSQPAQSVGGSGSGPYVFQFAAPTNGIVEVLWNAGHGIADLASPANAFAGGEWGTNSTPMPLLQTRF